MYSTKEGRARALALVRSKDFLRVVENFRRTEGIAPHPAVAFKILEEAKERENPKERERERPRSGKKRKAAEKSAPATRASTPRSQKMKRKANRIIF